MRFLKGKNKLKKLNNIPFYYVPGEKEYLYWRP